MVLELKQLKVDLVNAIEVCSRNDCPQAFVKCCFYIIVIHTVLFCMFFWVFLEMLDWDGAVISDFSLNLFRTILQASTSHNSFNYTPF